MRNIAQQFGLHMHENLQDLTIRAFNFGPGQKIWYGLLFSSVHGQSEYLVTESPNICLKFKRTQTYVEHLPQRRLFRIL